MSAEIQASRHEATLILTLSNPGAKNTLQPEMFAAAIEVLSTAERDSSIHAVILNGADNFFCAGGNLNKLQEIRAQDSATQAEAVDGLRGWIEAIRDCPKPVIAAVEGAAAGAGFALALACDLIVAGSTAQFLMSYVKVGLTPDGGASWLLPQMLPRQLATEILIEGKPISAQRLHELGVINRIVADGTALAAALQWADELAALSGHALELTKSLVQEAGNHTLSQHFELEKRYFIESLNHRDAQEGMRAFLEKRTPHYK